MILKNLPFELSNHFGIKNVNSVGFSDPANNYSFGISFVRQSGSVVNPNTSNSLELNSIFHAPFVGPFYNLELSGFSLFHVRPIQRMPIKKNICSISFLENKDMVKSYPINVKAKSDNLQDFMLKHGIKWYHKDYDGNIVAFEDINDYIQWLKV